MFYKMALQEAEEEHLYSTIFLPNFDAYWFQTVFPATSQQSSLLPGLWKMMGSYFLVFAFSLDIPKQSS